MSSADREKTLDAMAAVISEYLMMPRSHFTPTLLERLRELCERFNVLDLYNEMRP